jgi:gliding motility-associated-like protein
VIWEPFDANISCVECIDPLAWPYYTTTYTATLVDIYGCITRDDKTIYVDRRTKVYAPNIFSPNGDDDNDFFTLYTDHQIDVILSLKIYSRWGEMVYENGNFKPGVEKDGWDGTFKNQKVNPGVFAWYAIVQLVDGTERLIKGDVTVVR